MLHIANSTELACLHLAGRLVRQTRNMRSRHKKGTKHFLLQVINFLLDHVVSREPILSSIKIENRCVFELPYNKLSGMN